MSKDIIKDGSLGQIEVPDFLKLVKFRGHLAVIPQEFPGENRNGPLGLTARQFRAIIHLGKSNFLGVNEERMACVALNTRNPNLADRTNKLYEVYRRAAEAGEQYLVSSIVRQAVYTHG